MELKEINCVNIWKTSDAANLVFQWFFLLNSVKHKFFPGSIVKVYGEIWVGFYLKDILREKALSNKYRYLVRWYIKSTFYKRFLNWNKISKNKVVTGKTLFFVIGPFCTHYSICLNIGLWYVSFVWKWCAFNLSKFQSFNALSISMLSTKNSTPFFWKMFSFSRKSEYWKRSKFPLIVA